MIQPTSTAPDLDSTVRGLVLVLVVVLVLDSASSRVQSVPHDISRMQSTRGRLPYRPAPARGFALYPTR
jgi:Flp pilus assembly protein protease CpaA